MDSQSAVYFETQIGGLKLGFEGKQLYSLSIGDKSVARGKYTRRINMLNDGEKQKVLFQLEHYFSTAIAFHDISLAPDGTVFQKLVWRELSKIPKGETRTYGQIASRLNSSPRAVGNACRKNPIAIIIPCHRVVSANGIGGYMGDISGEKLNIKHWLLTHEGVSL